jgi:hypothetical protein
MSVGLPTGGGGPDLSAEIVGMEMVFGSMPDVERLGGTIANSFEVENLRYFVRRMKCRWVDAPFGRSTLIWRHL